MSQWIWKFGEFEIYHSQLVHNRREQYGYSEAPVWKIFAPETAVRFCKDIPAGVAGAFHITALGYHTTSVFDHQGRETKYRGRREIPLTPDTVRVQITVSNCHSFPCLFVEGDLISDGSWLASDLAGEERPVGVHPGFDRPEKTPDIFPFHYQTIAHKPQEEAPGGALFDFGLVTFAKTRFRTGSDRPLFIAFGESREEALDPEWSVIHGTHIPQNGQVELPAKAFRYLFVNHAHVDIHAEYEFLPLAYRGDFLCDEEIVNRVWNVAAYTFHLNSREFLLDGIKRDRWVWAGDAYQSLFVNRYLFFDADIERRTLTALGGKRPVDAHINTIMDYTFLWVISLLEHFITFGDEHFLRQIFPQAHELMQFCRTRTDADGFTRGRPGDWVFIDWAPMDKTGALCGEQILFAKALESFAEICAVLGQSDEGCKAQAQALQDSIAQKFYLPGQGVFVDSFESGAGHISRQSNLLAYLFLPLDGTHKKSIYQNVILADTAPPITTPYFKFYENQVHCQAGNTAFLEKSIREYYGSMLATGATTLYEEYDPFKTGAAHYAMYGNPYEKSLCHAWSASPIYLLGRYRLGVYNTGVAFNTFAVQPQLGDLTRLKGTVPLPGGSVQIELEDGQVKVLATKPGGTLVLADRRIPLQPNVRHCHPIP